MKFTRDKITKDVSVHPNGWLVFIFNDINNQYFKVAAGGPLMSLWHLKTSSLVSVLDEQNAVTTKVDFIDDNVDLFM